MNVAKDVLYMNQLTSCSPVHADGLLQILVTLVKLLTPILPPPPKKFGNTWMNRDFVQLLRFRC